MLFRHLPVTSEQDVTQNFEQLQAALPTLATGTATLHFAGFRNSEVLSVAHGLTTKPKVIVASGLGETEAERFVTISVRAIGGVSFELEGEVAKALTGNAQVCWIAVE